MKHNFVSIGIVISLAVIVSTASAVQSGFDLKDYGPPSPLHRACDVGLTHKVFDEGEFLLDTNITHVPAPGSQGYTAVAFDGTNYLVVWVDGYVYSGDIYGCRVSQTGVVLDPTGIAISTTMDDQCYPAVAFDGTNFLVVWISGDLDRYDIYGARVSQTGVVLDPAGIAISTATLDQWFPAVAFDGTNYLVVWEDHRNLYEGDIYGSRVTQEGVVLDPTGIAISTAPDNQFYPAVAFDGTNNLVVWGDVRDDNDIYGARVSQIGVVLDPSGIAISTAPENQWYPEVAFDGTNYLVVWGDYRSGNDIYGARVSQAGVVLDTSGIPISTAADDQDYPAVAFDGTNFLVVWGDDRSGNDPDIYGARVSQAGVVLDSSGIAISTAPDYQGGAALAFDASNYLVVWGDGRVGSTNSSDIFGSRVNQTGVVLDPLGIVISTVVYEQRSPAVAFDGTNFLTTWSDYRNGNRYDTYGCRVSQTAVVLDPAGIAISTTGAGSAAAFGETDFLVAWAGENGVYGTRVTPTGVVLDSTGIHILSILGSASSVAFDGQNFLVVAEHLDWPYSSSIYGARVTPAGVVLDNILIAGGLSSCFPEPAAAFDGENYLVVYADGLVYGKRVTSAGVVLDTTGIAISDEEDYVGSPAVAFDGEDYLVLWVRSNFSRDTVDIYGARVTPAGVVLDTAGIIISTASNDQGSPAIAFDGTNYLVVWEDYRNNPDTADIYGAWMTPDGTVFDEGPIVTQEGNQLVPAIVQGSGNQLFLVYQGWVGTVGNKTYNTDRIWGKLNPSTIIVELPKPKVQKTNSGATIIRGVINLQSLISNLQSKISLLDITGRKVADLKAGANNIHHLAPGVYFIRSNNNNKVTKVILTK